MSNQAAGRVTSEPVTVVMTVLTFAQLVLSGAGLADVVGPRVVFLGLLLTGAATGAVQFWVRSQTVAAVNVVAYVPPEGGVVAGSALMGVPEGVPVQVAPTVVDPPIVPPVTVP